MDISLGVPIPLNYQLSDYNNNYYVRAFLRDKTGSLIATVSLTLADSSGLYTNFSFAMPNTPWVLAKYAVYDDADFTTLSDAEGGGTDVFTLGSQAPVQSVVGIVQC